MKRRDPLKQIRLVENFNKVASVGTRVRVRLDDGTDKETTTRSEAWLLSGHTAVIHLDGFPACYMLERVTPL